MFSKQTGEGKICRKPDRTAIPRSSNFFGIFPFENFFFSSGPIVNILSKPLMEFFHVKKSATGLNLFTSPLCTQPSQLVMKLLISVSKTAASMFSGIA